MTRKGSVYSDCIIMLTACAGYVFFAAKAKDPKELLDALDGITRCTLKPPLGP